MSTFLLQPSPESTADPAWALSWHAYPCEINAETAEKARWLAAGQFTVAVHPGEHLASTRSPRLDCQLVAVLRLEKASSASDYQVAA